MVVDGLRSGPANMARDETLLSAGQQPTLRLYGWSAPTVSYGYFQEHDTDDGIEAVRVRRLTGGGAILHDRELTFSLSGPAVEPLLTRTEDLYRAVHGALARALHDAFGLTVSLRGGTRQRHEAFWCFTGGDPLDLVTPDEDKLVGSAQRRTDGRVLLHGSLPLATGSRQGGTGLESLLGFEPSWAEAADRLLDPFLKALGVDWTTGSFTDSESDLATRIEGERYGSDAWVRLGRAWLREDRSSPKLNNSHDFR